MKSKHLFFFSFIAIVLLALAWTPTKSQYWIQNGNNDEILISGRNVNMVEGDTLPGGDPWLQRQNEPSIAVSTRNPLHLLAAANDYRTVDVPFTQGPLPGADVEVSQAQGDAWIGIFKSFDGGESWITELLDGYPQLLSSSSPLHGYQAAADPVVRAGTDGLFYVCGMVFQRDPVTKAIGNSAIFVARYIDDNNKENGDTIRYLGTEIVLLGNPGHKFDKPWLAVDIPRSSCGNVYVVTADFVSNANEKTHGRVLFSKSTDCGQTWSEPLALTDAGKPYQGASIAIDPEDGTIYVAMRRFEIQLGKKHIEPNAIFVTKSTDFGQSFSNKVEVSVVDPFDQPTMPTMFRTNCYPTMTVDDNGVVYVAWSQKQPDGKARIVISTSTSGSSWSTPTPVELTHPSHPVELVGHQFMPTMTYANGKLMVAWYDSRYDKAGVECGPYDYIMDGAPPPCDWRHTIDVRVAEAAPGLLPVFNPSIQVSRYIFLIVPDSGVTADIGGWSLVQAQWNPPNYPLFQEGTTPFHGDYIDMSASPTFIWDEVLGRWRFNTEPTDAPVFHVTWTDNRDVSPPLEAPWDWADYTPTDYYNQEFSTGESPECGGDWRPGMRNQNVYTSKVSWGLEVGSAGNSKPLNIPRAFIIEVNNTTDEVKSFRLIIGDPGPGGQASFLQFFEDGYSIFELDVTIAPNSSISRPLFFYSSDPNASLRVDVVEIDVPGGTPVLDGLTSFIILNPGDAEAVLEDPDGWVGPPVGEEEIYDPVIELSGVYDWSDAPEWVDVLNPSMWSPSMWSPSMWSPSMWSNTIVVTPSMWSPSMWSPSMWSPSMWSPSMWSPSMWSPSMWSPSMWSGAVPDGTDLENARVVDVVWDVKNEGNTTSSYTFKTFAKEALPEGLYVQLIVYKTTYMSITDGEGCELKYAPQTELLANITNPSMWSPSMWSPSMWSTNIFNAAIENATFSIPPGEEANVLLRLIDENPQEVVLMENGEVFDLLAFANEIGGGVTPQQVNTSDAEAGIRIPRAASTKLLLGTAALPDGSVGVEYTGYVDAVGGDSANYTYTLNSGELPPDLYISTGYTSPYPYPRGIISGTPTTAGTYYFVVQVDDGTGQTDNQAYKITIHEGPVPDTPTITTPSPLPNAIQGVYYGVGLAASGGQLPYMWTLEPGSSLPDDLSLDQGGAITGKPVAPVGTYTFTVKVRDQQGDYDTKQFSLEIAEFTGTDVTISGMVYDTDGITPLNDVVIRGLPNTPITGAGDWPDGYYEDTVPQGWEGTARPFIIDHTFDPETREYSSGDTIVDIPNQNYNSVLPGVTVSGTLMYNGVPLVPAQVPAGAGNHGAYFWGDQGGGDWDFTTDYNYDDGTFTINGVQPGDYTLRVKVDTIAPFDDFIQEPGTFRGDFVFSVPEGQPTVLIDVPCQIYIHVTTPVDGSNAGPYTIPPTNSWMSPVTFAWDGVIGASTYTYNVNRVYTDGTPPDLNVVKDTIDQTTVSVPLIPSGANDYYAFFVIAKNSTNNQIGRLHIVWDTAITSLYYFLVTPPLDTDPPLVSNLNPSDDDSDADVFSNLVITFNENVQKGTGNITIHKYDDDSIVESIDVNSAKVGITDNVATVDSDITYAAETMYYVLIADSCFEDISGNPYAGINNKTAWNFETENSVWVDDDYGDGQYNDGHTWGVDAFDNIQAGIDAITAPGKVYVAAGTYMENVTITLPSGIEVLGSGENSTIIDGGGAGPTVSISFVNSTTKIDGFTITGGYAPVGGGMYVYDASPVVSNCSFINNEAYGTKETSLGPDIGGGGGMCNETEEAACNPTIINCKFINNQATDTEKGVGGGVANWWGANATLINCLFHGNTAVGHASAGGGGGLFSDFGSEPNVVNCTFMLNHADYSGGGMSQSSGDATKVINSIFWDNTANVAGTQIALVNNGECYISYSDVQDKDGNGVYDENGADPDPANDLFQEGAGVIDSDPLLNTSYHLSATSPCIDTGDNSAPSLPSYDFEGDPRILDGDGDTVETVDMGADEHHEYEFVLEWEGDPYFYTPEAVGIDVSGNVYVVEGLGNQIRKFDSNGNFILKWGSQGNGDGEFEAPIDIAIDSYGFVYVVEQNNHRIQKFDTNGNFILKWGSQGNGDGEFQSPRGVAVDNSNNLYIADMANHRVQKFDSNGNFLRKWGSYGIGNGQFNSPFGIAVDNSCNVYVLDTNNYRIQKFDSNGNFILTWGSQGSGDGELDTSFGIAVDSYGNVYVAGLFNDRIQKFNPDGTFVTKWGTTGNGDGEFNSPTDVAVNSSGFVYVADQSNARIQKFK